MSSEEPEPQVALDPFGPVPDDWRKLVSEMEAAGGAPNTREAARARLEIALLMAQLQQAQVAAKAEHARAVRDEAMAKVRETTERRNADARASAERRWIEERAAEERAAADNRAKAAEQQTRALVAATWVLAVTTGLLFAAALATFLFGSTGVL